MKYISVVIPCLNEEKTISSCIKEAQEGIKNSNSEYKVENIPRSAFTHTIWNNLEK